MEVEESGEEKRGTEFGVEEKWTDLVTFYHLST